MNILMKLVKLLNDPDFLMALIIFLFFGPFFFAVIVISLKLFGNV